MGSLVKAYKPLATIEKEVARIEKQNANPLLMIPVELAAAVNFFISTNAHLVKSALPISTRIVGWLRLEGISHEGMRAALSNICRANRQARHEHVGQLMADLSEEVDRILKEERQIEISREFHSEMKRWDKERATSDEVLESVKQYRNYVKTQESR
jgi:hypothetical protein